MAQLAAAFEADVPHDDRPAAGLTDPTLAVNDRDLGNLGHPDPGPARHAAPDTDHPSTGARTWLSGAHLRVVAAVCVAALVLLGWMLLSGRPQTSDPVGPVAMTSPGASGTTGSTGTGGPVELVVDVVGEVERPGIVTVPRGSRVFEAIEAAGGLDGKVDTSGVNLARVLEDGEQVVVGPAPEIGSTGVGPTGAAAGGKIRLNQATAEQLDTLPGVGPVTAAAIIAWREDNGRFSTVDDLLDVRGIGDATLAELRELVMP